MKRSCWSFILAGVVALSAHDVVPSALAAQAAAETYSATATVKGPEGHDELRRSSSSSSVTRRTGSGARPWTP